MKSEETPMIEPMNEQIAKSKPSSDGLIYIEIMANGRTDSYSFRVRAMYGNISSEYRSASGMSNALHSALTSIFGNMVEKL